MSTDKILTDGFAMAGTGVKAVVCLCALTGGLCGLFICSPLILVGFLAARWGLVK